MLLDWSSHNPDTAWLYCKALLWSMVAGCSTGLGGLVVVMVDVVTDRLSGFLMAFGTKTKAKIIFPSQTN
jgi:hypothetical protein